jgi:cytochrome c553
LTDRSALAAVLVACGALAAAAEPRADAPSGAADAAVARSLASALAIEGDVESGRELYRRCAVCHLDNGAGRPDGVFPQLAGQHRSVLVKQLVDIREGRRTNPVMKPHARALLDEREIADVAAYVAALPVPEPLGRGEGRDLARGERLYRRDCAGCHGARGEGDAARFVPALADQHYAYLLRQIRAIAGGRRAKAHPDVERRVAEYSDAELKAVVDYASRLRGSELPQSAPIPSKLP